MSLEQLIQNYGYLAVLIGTFLEGEMILILGGFAAQLGHLDLRLVMLCGFVGSFCGDQLYFYIGRFYGPRIIAKRISWQVNAERVYKRLRKHKNFLILTFRFYYGLRNVTPFAIGASQVSPLRFFILNMIGAIVWAISLGLIGYFFGEAITYFTDTKYYQWYLLGGLVFLGVGVWLIIRLRERKRAREQGLK
jgi:membrane protein DedA with SNARE-associated domain